MKIKEAWLQLEPRRVRYLECGSGAPIIFAAGLGISADFYKSNMESLAHAGFRAIAPDLPGFGKTKGPAFGASVPELTDYLVACANALQLRNAGWIGHSLGCQPLLRIAREHPELVRAFVLAGPTGGYGPRLARQAQAIGYAAVTEPWRLLKAVLRDYARISPFTYVGTWVKANRDDPVRNSKEIRVPSLILVGTRDRVPRPEFIGNLASVLKADVIRLPGGNHGLPIDSQFEFDQAVIRFFKQQR
jgi:2-hydroxy-6-oxonona-2,4-dienedioate hydrolase